VELFYWLIGGYEKERLYTLADNTVSDVEEPRAPRVIEWS
jgi:hypothetical protein